MGTKSRAGKVAGIRERLIMPLTIYACLLYSCVETVFEALPDQGTEIFDIPPPRYENL